MWRVTGARTRLELLMAVVDDFYRGYGRGSAHGPGSGRRARAREWRNLHLEVFASKEIQLTELYRYGGSLSDLESMYNWDNLYNCM